MNPKEKAYELFIFYYGAIKYAHTNLERANIAKRCATRAVEEVMTYMTPQTDSKEAFDYWRDVKAEIQKV